jgi:hypothetical protein
MRNKQGVNKWGVNRTKKNNKRYVKGGESRTKYILAYENPLFHTNNYEKKGLHKYIMTVHDKVNMTFKEIFNNMDENMALIREGRNRPPIQPKKYYVRTTNNVG